MTVVSGIAIRMVQTDVNAKVDPMILGVPPARVDNLVRVCRGVNGTVGDSIIHAIVAIVRDPVSEAVGPVNPLTRVAYACLRRRHTGRRGRRAKFESLLAGKREHTVIVCIVWRGMIEDRLLGGCARIGRIQEWRDRLRDNPFRRGATHAEAKTAEQDGFENVLE
jgi:hypothetical protein